MSEAKFKNQMEGVFQAYLSKMPKSESTFASAIARITWLKDSMEKINIEMTPLVTEYSHGDEVVKKRLQTLVVLRTKEMTAQFS